MKMTSEVETYRWLYERAALLVLNKWLLYALSVYVLQDWLMDSHSDETPKYNTPKGIFLFVFRLSERRDF